MKFRTRIVSLVLAIFLFVSVFATGVSAASTDLKLGIAFVDASSLRLRANPSTTSQTLDFAYRDEVVVLLEKTGQWYKVIYNLRVGYMHGSYLKVTTRENAELGCGRVTGDKVNVRSGPGTGYAAVARANTGDQAYIIGINQQWFKVIFRDTIGYIRSDYLVLTEIPYENRASAKTPLFFRGGKSTGVTPSPGALKGDSNLRQGIVAEAKRYIGVPYLWGGTTPGGFDCSGFVQYVFQKKGVTLPRTSSQQWSASTRIAKADLRPGDLVFFATGGSGVSHVGIYVGGNQFIHSSTSKGVVISDLGSAYWAGCYYGSGTFL